MRFLHIADLHLGKQMNDLLLLEDQEAVLDQIVQIAGKEKVDVVKALYTGILEDAKGTAYTLIRVAARTNMDAVFAHYVGAMAEAEDGNDDYNDNDY